MKLVVKYNLLKDAGNKTVKISKFQNKFSYSESLWTRSKKFLLGFSL